MDREHRSPPPPRFAGRAVLLLGVTLVVALTWLIAWPSARPLSSEWGAGPADRADAVRIVRDTFAGAPDPAARARLLLRSGKRRVHVTVYQRAHAVTATADGLPTAAALAKAAKQVMGSFGGAIAPDSWIRIDVDTAEAALGEPTRDSLELDFEPGVDGIRAESGESLGIVLPSDPITEGWWTPYRDLNVNGRLRPNTRGSMGLQTVAVARTRLAQNPELVSGPLRLVRFRTDSFLARAGAGDPIPLFRGMPEGPDVPAAAEIRRSMDAGAGWLLATLGSDGKFTRYTYLPDRDTADPLAEKYNVIRHIAAAWALETLGARHGRRDWVDAGEKAMRWVDPFIVPAGRTTNGVPQYVLAAEGATRGGLGETATAVLALLARGPALDATGTQKLEGLGATLEWMQRDDGGFYESEAEAEKRGVKKPDKLLYEPGEALLALVALAEAKPAEKHWLDSALRSARYQSSCFEDAWRFRDCYGEEEGRSTALRLASVPDRIPRWAQVRFVDRVHWQTQALERLARLTGDLHWARVAVDMGNAILMTASPPNQVAQAADGTVLGPLARDCTGGFPWPGGLPRTTPSGSRAEAVNAARRAAILLGRDPAPFEAALLRMHGFQLRNQYTVASCYWCSVPAHAQGAFRAGLLDDEVRIDFVQHVIASMSDTLAWYDRAPATSAR